MSFTDDEKREAIKQGTKEIWRTATDDEGQSIYFLAVMLEETLAQRDELQARLDHINKLLTDGYTGDGETPSYGNSWIEEAHRIAAI